MKEEFNLEQVLGKLASALNNNQYRDNFRDAIKKLLPYSGNPEIVEVVKSAVDIAVEKQGPQMGLYLLQDLLGELKQPQSDAALELKELFTLKWQTTLDEGAAKQPSNILMYLTSAARGMADDSHPLAPLVVSRWSALFDQLVATVDAKEKSYELRASLSLDDIKNPVFRQAALGKLDALKDSDADIVMKILSDTFTRGGFYGFKDDKQSINQLLNTLSYLLEKQKGTLPEETIEDLSWRVFVNSEGNPATAKTAGRIYLGLADKKADAPQAFNMYRSIFGRNNLDVNDLRIEAANKALDLADTGKLANNSRDASEVVRNIFDEIFYPSTQKETRDDALAARAANTLYPYVSSELTKTGGRVSFQYFNTAVSLIEYLPKTDPREAELVDTWKASLAANVKTGYDKEYYARQMGWMLDVATKKKDVELADYTRKEWLDTVDTVAKKSPHDAYKIVKEVVTNARYYNTRTQLLADAEALLPDLEKRAGIIKTPDEVSLADVKKILAAKKQPKATP